MLQVDIECMRGTVSKLIKRRRPPRKVGILQEHADFLKVPYRQQLDGVTGHTLGGEAYQIVMVKTGDLVVALKDATGNDFDFEIRAEGSSSESVDRDGA